MAEILANEDKQLSDTNNNDDDMDNSNNSGGDGTICRDYQRGVCNRGGKCKFGHPEGLGKEVESSPMICRDFQNGKCSRGTCKYMHISIVEEKLYLRTGQMPPRRPPPMHGGPPMRGGPGGFGGGGGGYPTRAARSDPVCKDFLNNKCTRGSTCKYRHAYEDDHAGSFSASFDDFPRKRRRDSFGDSDFAHMKEDNESLRRQVADLQKQVSDLKATNEVLLDQNARYRNAATSSTSYPATPSYGSSYSKPPASGPPANTYSTSYPSSYNGGGSTTTTSYSSYTADSAVYTSNSSYGAPSSDSSAYNSSYPPSGTGYTKFE